jgi:hypothetical protein
LTWDERFGSSILESSEVVDISPAAVRLYARAVAIESEIEEAIADGDWMTTEEPLAWSDRLLRGDLDVEAETKAKAAILARRREYQWVETERSRQLGLGPDEALSILTCLTESGTAPTTPRIEPRKRTLELTHRLSVAHTRRPARLRVVFEAETPARPSLAVQHDPID